MAHCKKKMAGRKFVFFFFYHHVLAAKDCTKRDPIPLSLHSIRVCLKIFYAHSNVCQLTPQTRLTAEWIHTKKKNSGKYKAILFAVDTD